MRARLSLLLPLALAPSCASPPAPTPSPSLALSPPPPPFLTPSRIAPDILPDSHLVSALPDGSRRYLIAGMRILERPDGSREQARTLLPAGLYRALDLPSRLGGGVLFVASAGGTTLIFRAPSWLGELSPFVRLQEASRELVLGFDRLYLRLHRGDEWIALDPQTGARTSLGPLPEGPRVGPLAFADAWRAATSVDLRGPMATFDAGASWRPVPLDEAPVTAVVTEGDDLIFATRAARYRLGPDGEVSREPLAGKASAKRERWASVPKSPTLGDSPLRAAVADGALDGEGHGLVARGGALARVRLNDGLVVATNRQAYDASAGDCHAIALGTGTGFVCGASEGTSIHRLDPPLSMHEVLRFSGPRLVLASGTGGLAIQGGCDAEGTADANRWCVRTRDGRLRELPLSQATGDERVVVLADGRVAVLTPPREGQPAKLSLVGEKETRTLPLEPNDPALSQAVWLQGFEEREPGVLGGWLDTGSALRGVRIGLDGKVTLGAVAVDPATTIVSGRFALALGSGSYRLRESKDGGMSFADVDLPANLPRAEVEARSCGPLGCVAGGWLRLGWGEAETKTAPSPQPSMLGIPRVRGLSLRCEWTGEASGPVSPPPKPEAPRSPLPAAIAGLVRPRSPAVAAPKPKWIPFRGAPAPVLAPGEIGFDGGTDPANLRIAVPLRVYAWGPKGADWSRSGSWLARFDDRFDLAGVRTTAKVASPFADEESAAELLDLPGGPPVAWSTLLDPSGKAAVFLACRSGRCSSFGATDGGALVPFRDLELSSASDASAVFTGQRWFVLAPAAGQNAQQELVLFRIDGGQARELTRLPRSWAGRDETPRLLRRAISDELGLVILGAAELDRGTRDWFVLPLDAETGALGEPVRMSGSHLDGDSPPPRCTDDADGWLMDTQPSPLPALRMLATPGTASPVLTTAGVRLRLSPGRACVDAIAARVEGLSTLPPRSEGRALDASSAVPAFATDSATGRRFGLRCAP